MSLLIQGTVVRSHCQDLPVHFVSLKAVEAYIPEDLKNPLSNWNPNGSPSLTEFPETYQKSIRLIRLMTVQGQSWAIGFKFERWVVGDGNTLATGLYCLDKK